MDLAARVVDVLQEVAAKEEQFRRRAEHERLTREARQQRQQQQVRDSIHCSMYFDCGKPCNTTV